MAEQNANAGAQAQQQNLTQNATALKRFQEETTEQVLAKINLMQEAGEIKLPANYSAGNAAKLGWLYLVDVKNKDGKPAIEVCTKESICNAFLKMVIKGLSVAKKQCYFIVYGNQLNIQEDYRGTLMIAKRDTPIAEVNAQVIYDGDTFVYTVDEKAKYQLVKHETNLKNINIDKITGAYAIVVNKDGSKWMEIMTIAQIRNAWAQGAAEGKNKAHIKFADQMCKKTVIGRACKIEIGSSDDSGIMDDDDDLDGLNNDTAKLERKTATAERTVVDAVAEDVTFENINHEAAQQPETKQTKGNTADLFPEQREMKKECPI
jgi:recombination protein RecT